MRENQQRRYCCEGYYLLGGAPCAKAAREDIDGFALCEGHALEAKLEGQISCWDGMLFHIDLWSREASRREREDVVGLLKDQRGEATSARHRACEDLDVLRRGETPLGEVPSGLGDLSRRGSLPLPPKAARPLSVGLGRLRRR